MADRSNYVFGIFLLIMLAIWAYAVFGFDSKCVDCPDVELTCPKPLCLEPICPEPSVNVSCPDYPSCPDCVYYEQPETQLSHFQQVINSVCTERDYELDVWDCSDESAEGIKRLKNAGYKGWHMDCGFYYINETGVDKERHCWGTDGKLLVEFVTCEIVHPRDYWRYKG